MCTWFRTGGACSEPDVREAERNTHHTESELAGPESQQAARIDVPSSHHATHTHTSHEAAGKFTRNTMRSDAFEQHKHRLTHNTERVLAPLKLDQ